MKIGMPDVVPSKSEFTAKVRLEGMASVVVYQDFQGSTYATAN
jgi:hypothetical protein